jgi:hypothetical protein
LGTGISEKERVVMQKDDKWENQIGFYRFPANKKVGEEKLVSLFRITAQSNVKI